MYKRFKEYSFRDIVGKFVLMKNTDIFRNANEYKYIDESVEKIKQYIIKDTKDYYIDTLQYDEELDFEDTFSVENLNEDMTTRKVTQLYEPMYGYVSIDRKRGFVLYLLGNEEDKLKYVYSPTYWSCDDKFIENIEIKIIDEDEYEYARLFKEQIQDDEESDEDVINTRNLKELDMFRIEFSPDFVSCFVRYKNINYIAKVKLERLEQENIYAKYHESTGILKLIKENNNYYLIYIPVKKINEELAFKKYISSILTALYEDFDVEEDDAIKLIKEFQETIKSGYISGDLPNETIIKIWNKL